MVIKKKLSTEEPSEVVQEPKKSTKTLEKPKVSYEYVQKGVIQVCLACGGQKSTDGSNKLVCTAPPDQHKDCPRR